MASPFKSTGERQLVSLECKDSTWQFLTFYMLLIFILHFSTDEHLKLIKGSKLFLPFENSLIFYVFHNLKIAIWDFGLFYRHIIEELIMQMSNM